MTKFHAWIVTHNDVPKAVRYTSFSAQMALNALKEDDFASWLKKPMTGSQQDRLHYVSLHHWAVIGPFDMDDEIVIGDITSLEESR